MKILLFEGAGWPSAESGDVGNCRIRTRIKNNDGVIIYLEMGCTPGKNFRDCRFDLITRVDHCHTHENGGCKWRKLEGMPNFEYSKANIINWVNKNLNCSFTDLVVDNENIEVHATNEPLY